MKTPILLVVKAGFRFTGLVLVSSVIGAGSVGAETYRHGGSTATIEQSGGNGTSKTRIFSDKEGQTIISEDGSSTDITIQRSADSPRSADSWGYSQSGEDRFDRRSIEERFSGIDIGARSAGTDSEYGSPSTSEEFKRRMLDRTRSHLFQ